MYSLQLPSLLAFPALCVSWPRLGFPLSIHLSLPCNTIFVLVTCESKAWHCEWCWFGRLYQTGTCREHSWGARDRVWLGSSCNPIGTSHWMPLHWHNSLQGAAHICTGYGQGGLPRGSGLTFPYLFLLFHKDNTSEFVLCICLRSGTQQHCTFIGHPHSSWVGGVVKLQDKITFQLCDYRSVPGYHKYNRIISWWAVLSGFLVHGLLWLD